MYNVQKVLYGQVFFVLVIVLLDHRPLMEFVFVIMGLCIRISVLLNVLLGLCRVGLVVCNVRLNVWNVLILPVNVLHVLMDFSWIL